ncbi:MAG: hypothetical protein KC442_09890 [Thermomicrobiales bacterium]|nr:hypothetical protein [Thermomicrobiales bacterium]
MIPHPRPSPCAQGQHWAALLTLTLALLCALVVPASAQEAAPLEVASGPLSERTLGFVARIEQRPDQLNLFGYLSRASGLTLQDLFAADTDQVSDARFTFSAEIALQPAANRADTTTFTGEGTLRVYLAPDGGAAWGEPASFSAGDLLAEYELSLREILQRQAPQVVVLVGDGTLSQTTANDFTLGGTAFRFGAVGLAQRLHYTGALTPETTGGALTAVANGHTEVASRDVIIVRMGRTAASTPAPTETSASVACELEPWLGDATAALALAADGVSGLDLSNASAVDVTAVERLAEQIEGAIGTLRTNAVPEDASNANRLLVTALSTTARGLSGIAAAPTSDDDASFSQAAATVRDGQSLLDQAQGAVAALAAACPAE